MNVQKIIESYNAKLTVIAGTFGSSIAQIWGFIPDSVGKAGVILSVVLSVLVIQGQRKKNENLELENKIKALELENATREAEKRRRKED